MHNSHFSDITMYQLDASYVDEVAREGFSALENFVDHATVASVTLYCLVRNFLVLALKA